MYIYVNVSEVIYFLINFSIFCLTWFVPLEANEHTAYNLIFRSCYMCGLTISALFLVGPIYLEELSKFMTRSWHFSTVTLLWMPFIFINTSNFFSETETGSKWVEEDTLDAHSDWVRDVAWAPNCGLPDSILASCSLVSAKDIGLNISHRKQNVMKSVFICI